MLTPLNYISESMKNIFVGLFIVFAVSKSAFGQLNNDMLNQQYIVEEQDSNTLWIGVRAMAFNKNNEYFNDITDGLTLFGYQLNPYMSYRAGKHVRMDVGVYLQQDFGNDDYTAVLPTFSIKYNDGGHHIIFGTLEHSYNHKLIEPLYDFEKGLIDRLEYGLQAIFDKEKWNLDTWLSWEKMIYPYDPNQEELVFGMSGNYKLKDEKDIQWKVPVQVVVYHKGGQIDTNPNALVTTTNTALGVDLRKKLSGKLAYWGMQHYYVGYKEFSNVASNIFGAGNAIYLNTTIVFKSGFEFQGSYWNSNGFVPIQGGKLYSSESSTVKTPGYIEQNRHLFILRCFYNKEIADGLSVSTRFEPYYDIQNGVFEFSHGMYLNFTPEFFITKIKKVRR